MDANARRAAQQKATNAMKSGWKLIKTAPRDGSPILVYYPTKYGVERYSVRYWSPGNWGLITEGWVDAWRQISPNDNPSHWQPLDAPHTRDADPRAVSPTAELIISPMPVGRKYAEYSPWAGIPTQWQELFNCPIAGEDK